MFIADHEHADRDNKLGRWDKNAQILFCYASISVRLIVAITLFNLRSIETKRLFSFRMANTTRWKRVVMHYIRNWVTSKNLLLSMTGRAWQANSPFCIFVVVFVNMAHHSPSKKWFGYCLYAFCCSSKILNCFMRRSKKMIFMICLVFILWDTNINSIYGNFSRSLSVCWAVYF